MPKYKRKRRLSKSLRAQLKLFKENNQGIEIGKRKSSKIEITTPVDEKPKRKSAKFTYPYKTGDVVKFIENPVNRRSRLPTSLHAHAGQIAWISAVINEAYFEVLCHDGTVKKVEGKFIRPV